MKIGLIVPGFSSSEHDWCIPALLDTVRVLAQHHEVHVVTLRYPHIQREYEVYGAKVYALGGATTGGIGKIVLLVRAVLRILYCSRGKKFDVLHGLWADEPGLVATMAGKLLRVPVIVSLMGGELVNMPELGYGHQLSRAARKMISISTRFADKVTVGSELLFDRAKLQVHSEKLFTAPLGVDPLLFCPQGEKMLLKGDLKLLFVASLSPIKNPIMLLQTLEIIRNTVPNVHLHVLGNGILRSELERMAWTIGIAPNVTFHGDVSHELLPQYYRAADLCLLTSHYESQSMVALEAAACGKVTLGTRVGLLPELVGDEWLVSSEDAEKLAALVIQFANDSKLRDDLEKRVYTRLIEQYPLLKCVLVWQRLYIKQ